MSHPRSPEAALAVMQPYVFPYLGYFHLIEASELLVFYDDVAYRPRTWMNRNRILVDGQPHTFTVPVRGGSQNTRISEVELAIDERWRRKFTSTLGQAYRTAPHFGPVRALVDSVLDEVEGGLADLAINSITAVYRYLGRDLDFVRSSVASPESVDLPRAERLAHLTRQFGFRRYVNLPSGRALYDREQFAALGVDLGFVQGSAHHYDQGPGQPFVADLSILDVLMHCEPPVVVGLLGDFSVEP